jgi:hypothetical protein
MCGNQLPVSRQLFQVREEKIRNTHVADSNITYRRVHCRKRHTNGRKAIAHIPLFAMPLHRPVAVLLKQVFVNEQKETCEMREWAVTHT